MTDRVRSDVGADNPTGTGGLSVEVDGHPLLPLHPSHFAPGQQPAPRKRRKLRLALILLLGIVLIPMLVIGGALGGGVIFLEHKLDSNITRFPDPFVGIPAASRPPAAPGDAENILLLGSDSRISAGDPSDWVAGAQRTDAIMILHVPADRSGAYLMSIPRDSWVPIPGHGTSKINAAFSWGGPTLTVRTVEQLTGIRIDHVVIADFDGFSKVTDALGGVTITVPASSGVPGANVPAGTRLMDGATALKYVRERHHLPGGDFDRERRQQNWMRAIAQKTLSSGTLTSPIKLTRVLSGLSRAIEVDDGFSLGQMRDLGLSMRDVRGADLHFMTVPVHGTGRSPDGKQSIVLLAPTQDKALFRAAAQDKMADWTAAHPDLLLGDTVR